MAVKKLGQAGSAIFDFIVDQFDPRFSNPVAGSGIRKGEIDAIKGTKVTVEDAPNVDLPLIDLRDYEGHGIVTGMSDRTAAGGYVTKIDNQELSRPILREGGQDYMILNPDVWASDPKV